MHAIIAKCFSILGYGIGKSMRRERKIKDKKVIKKGADKIIMLPIIIAEAGVVKPKK